MLRNGDNPIYRLCDDKPIVNLVPLGNGDNGLLVLLNEDLHFGLKDQKVGIRHRGRQWYRAGL